MTLVASRHGNLSGQDNTYREFFYIRYFSRLWTNVILTLFSAITEHQPSTAPFRHTRVGPAFLDVSIQLLPSLFRFLCTMWFWPFPFTLRVPRECLPCDLLPWLPDSMVYPASLFLIWRSIRGLVNIKKYIKIQKSLDTMHPTHATLYPQKKFRKISKVINHEYLYIEARTKA